MSSFFNCAAYDDVDTTIRLDDHVVFLALEDKGKNTSIHLTLNPFQVRVLAKYLSVALSQIEFKALQEEKNFGDLSVQIINEDNGYYHADNFYDNDYAIAVPF
ncbi:MAG: hypothetical protein IJG33_01865 [Selenomonadaceae bacterium]|nr:hypothetical protein [Selenomonadaceae bacterium]